jgi:hypothetical protein
MTDIVAVVVLANTTGQTELSTLPVTHISNFLSTSLQILVWHTLVLHFS